MKDLDSLTYNKDSEDLVKVLCQKTQNNNPAFFRIMVAYYFCKIASMMRVTIVTKDRGEIPINLYGINLAPSGYGKGLSTNIIEDNIINRFREPFLEDTFRIQADKNLAQIATRRAIKKGTEEEDELVKATKEFEQLGELAFSFDSATTAAVKQMRHKLLMANAGSVNMEIDEIGSNLLGQIDVLNTFLELFDVGKVKQKLTKNTAENVRNEEIEGKTPTNMMLFGTPSKLLNGSKTEDEFMSLLESGFGRRCFFGYSKAAPESNLTPQEIYDLLTNNSSEATVRRLSNTVSDLADPINFHKKLMVDKDVSILLIKYKLYCESIAKELPEHEEIKKAEISHRYFKALKLAGAYAFIGGDLEIKESHLYEAIKLAEDSGKAFNKMMNRDRDYVRLAKYVSSVEKEVTHADLVEDLPFYKGTNAKKDEMMKLAIAYGYKNNIVIKKSYSDGIEFFTGESLKETNIDKLIISFSNDLAAGYRPEYAPFSKLSRLTQNPGLHWCNHHLLDNYRKEENAIPGFNTIVLDVDGETNIKMVQLLLKDYSYHIHTTKRHTDDCNRFRIIMPISHTLKMDANEFKEFMKNIYEWLPFDCDTQTNQRSRKWLTHKGEYFTNEGDLLDALLFIPKTSKNEERKKICDSQQSLTNLERWFCRNIETGNRSNFLIRFAYLLIDSGKDFSATQDAILSLNNKLPDPLPKEELESTILVTVGKKIVERDSKQ